MNDGAMHEREARLARFLAKDEPPARDYVFEARVAFAQRKDRIERSGVMRGLWLGVGLVLLWTLLSAEATFDGEAGVMMLVAGVLGGAFLLVRKQFTR